MPTSANSSTTSKWLVASNAKLEKAGIAIARLDCLVLLEDVTGKDRSYILAHPEYELASQQVRELASKIERRAMHEPLAYIRGKSEFYGREFLVTPDTLEPRPETETMISQFLSLLEIRSLTDKENVNLKIADVGTGSGCIGITVKLEIPKVKVYATEINQAALDIAKQNAEKLGANITFVQGDLIERLKTKKLDVLLCNLPYVPDSHTINEAAMHEPEVAIFGGVDGLDLYRKLFDQIAERTQKPRFVLTESLPFQHHALATIVRKYNYILEKTEDFIQVFSLSEQLPK